MLNPGLIVCPKVKAIGLPAKEKLACASKCTKAFRIVRVCRQLKEMVILVSPLDELRTKA